jgi:predicted DCC family thiol-disulfide oxidoreductase YuxK
MDYHYPLSVQPKSAMYSILQQFVRWGLAKSVPATGLGVYRILFGLVAFQEILFLFYFRHLIFDPLPYVDQASPILHLLLLLWAAAALALALGYRTRLAAAVNYLFWVLFPAFTPMWHDFDGGLDQLMAGSSLLLLFIPAERALSLDNLRARLRQPLYRPVEAPASVSVLCYLLPVTMALACLYLDAGIHKLSAEFWRNGVGSWLPPTHPYYMNAWDWSWLLDNRWAEKGLGYTILAFQFVFPALFWHRRARVPLMALGSLFHTGIIISLNIYPFGFAMLVHYVLMVPFRWWRALGRAYRAKAPRLTVYYDEQCPLCNRTATVVSHFDLAQAVLFRGLQGHARECRALDGISEGELLQDLYAVDGNGKLYRGLDTYIRILRAMGYAAPLGWLLNLPGVYGLAARVYRRIADQRQRLACGGACPAPAAVAEIDPWQLLAQRYLGDERKRSQRLAKCLLLLAALQLNSTLHYGVLYRLGIKPAEIEWAAPLAALSNGLLTFSHSVAGITPHALYMHDHFEGFDQIVGITYRDKDGREQWLPFVNEQGRIVAPNWARIQCMWANVAVTAHMKTDRLEKFLRKITAFYGPAVGLDTRNAVFTLKLKHVTVPNDWQAGLRRQNLAEPWRDIGSLTWRDGMMRMDIMEGVKLEAL